MLKYYLIALAALLFFACGKEYAPKKAANKNLSPSTKPTAISKAMAGEVLDKCAEKEEKAWFDTDAYYDQNAKYQEQIENSFLSPLKSPYSTFSIDVDTASYTNTRRYLNDGHLPPLGTIREEEFINYFKYDYSAENYTENSPFSVYTQTAICPWEENHRILHIGIQGKQLLQEQKKASNLVFLIDVSGSMSNDNKLPLLKKGFELMIDHLHEDDKVSIVVYAGASGLVLPPTKVKNKNTILGALKRLTSGGSTNGAAGIHLAYQVAQEAFIQDGNNRVILATDGDFNVGQSDTNELKKLIENKRKSDVYLSILGFGMGNLNDHMMETIANNGNGNYFYIDRLSEARKVLVEQLHSTIFTIAKDVKIQIEFNPQHIAYYRLIGYVNRKLKDEDFNNDQKDAGEIGSGHTVTALYEIVPTGANSTIHSKIDELKYQKPAEKKEVHFQNSPEALTLKIRFKKPDGDVSSKQEFIVDSKDISKQVGDENLIWATAVAAFAQKLNGSEFLNQFSWDQIKNLALQGKGHDEDGYRGEMIRLIKLAKSLQK